jgi:glucose/arabinose dehydrogenase
MYRYRLKKLLLAAALITLAGCSHAMQARVPEGLLLKPVAACDPGSPFDVSRTGVAACVDSGGIGMRSPQGELVTVKQAPATALAFSPDGEMLAAAVPAGKLTILRLFDGKGRTVAEAKVSGRATSIVWRSGEELLCGVIEVHRYGFGTELVSILYQWDGKTAPKATTLADVTLRRQVAAMPDELLFNQFLLALSPYGDEIAYTTIKDPPLFSPYLRVMIRHLETGAETEVTQTSIGSGTVAYAPDGESLVVSDGTAGTRKISLADAKLLEELPPSPGGPALSPSGAYSYLNGNLYQQGKAVASFPPEAKGAFLRDGSRLALSHDGKLYLLSGLKDAAQVRPAELERILKLRRLKSQGLISDSEYRKEKEKVTP